MQKKAKLCEANLQTQTLCELLFRLWIAIGLADRPKDKVDTLPGFNVVSTSKKKNVSEIEQNVQRW